MKTDNIVESLKQYGVRAEAYKRPPIGDDVFAMTIVPRHKEGVVLINHGNAEIQAVGSKKLRQAAITVHENGRKVTRLVEAIVHSRRRPSLGDMTTELKRDFPIIMPRESTWEVKGARSEKHEYSTTLNPRWRITGEVTAEVKQPTTNHFLIGMDETRHFISPISRHVESVREAHRILKPRIKRKTFRQGEWFFIPCGKVMARKLDKLVAKHPNELSRRQLDNTSHTAKSAVELADGDIYARGYITDRRQGHHKPVFLKEWHKVVKNKESKIKVASFQREIVARRARTWD